MISLFNDYWQKISNKFNQQLKCDKLSSREKLVDKKTTRIQKEVSKHTVNTKNKLIKLQEQLSSIESILIVAKNGKGA